MPPTRRALVTLLLLALVCQLPARELLAQPNPTASAAESARPEDLALARSLGEQGFLLFDAGEYEIAAERFARAIELYAAPTLRLGRARALEHLGRLVAASEEFRRAAQERPQAQEPSSFALARADARTELARVVRRLAHLTVRLTTSGGPLPQGWSLGVDGQAWAPASVGVARPFDPGQHRVAVTLSDGQRIERVVHLNEGGSATVTLELPLESSEPAVTSSAPIFSSAEPTSDAPHEVSPSNTPLLVAAITTAVLTVGAVATGIVAWSKRTDYDQNNRRDVDESTKVSLREDAERWNWINAGVTAAALGGAGFTLYYWLQAPEAGAHNLLRPGSLGYRELGASGSASSALGSQWGVQWETPF